MNLSKTQKKERVVVLGGGIGGLSAGYYLSKTGNFDVTVLEKEGITGGLCSSFEHNGFILDHGAHKIYSVVPGVLDSIHELMGSKLLELPKKNRLYLQGHLVDYPLRLGNLASVLGIGLFLKIGIGYGLELVKNLFSRKKAASYEDYMIQRFGRQAYELVFQPLAEKVWGDPKTLHPEMARARVPASGGMEVILKLLGLKKETVDTNAEFFFYPRNGFGEFPESLHHGIESMGGLVIVNADVQEILRKGEKITSVKADVNGEVQEFLVDYLVSSIPIIVLGKLLFGSESYDVIQSISNLQFRHLILVYIFVKRPLVLEDQWIFFPEEDYIFSRIFEQKQMNPELGPESETVICCDFTCSEESWKWNAEDDLLVEKTVDGLIDAGFIQSEDVSSSLVKRVRNFYPRYDLEYVEKLTRMNAHLQKVENLLLTGRIGMYNYNNSDHCVDMGKFIAEHLSVGQNPRVIWNNLEKRVADYKIVD